MNVERFAGAPAEWDDAVRSDPRWTHFHLYGWKRVIEEAFGHECPYLVARGAGGAIAGVLPLVRVRSLLFGHYLVSMPFLNYGGPLGGDEAVRALADHASGLARSDGVKLLELRSREPLPVDMAVSMRKITVVLDVPAGEPAKLFDSFKAKLRSQLRKPQKEGVTVRFGPAEVEPFYRIFARHMRDLGTPSLPRKFFDRIAREFPEDAWFACAYLGDVPVAGGAGFRWNGEFEMTWASSLGEYNRLAANMALYWAFMERAANERLAVFNFGRCSPGSGTHRFKQQWGSRDVPLYWYQLAPGGAAAATPSPDDAKYAWGPRLWKRLPLPIANVAGPAIVKWIP